MNSKEVNTQNWLMLHTAEWYLRTPKVMIDLINLPLLI